MLIMKFPLLSVLVDGRDTVLNGTSYKKFTSARIGDPPRNILAVTYILFLLAGIVEA